MRNVDSVIHRYTENIDLISRIYTLDGKNVKNSLGKIYKATLQ